MKKWILMLAMTFVLPFSVAAQDDDMYFVPSKRSVEKRTVPTQIERRLSDYYPGSNRDIDEYNRRSYYQVLPADSANDIIVFQPEKGVYPDSDSIAVDAEDFQLTRRMARYDGYEPGNSFWEGYNAGRRDAWASSWHSPWFYSSYYPWYDSWYDPWYFGYHGWHGSWYYDPWYYGYYGWGYPYHHYGWYDPWYYGHYYGWGGYYGGGGSYYRNSHAGTINRRGSSSTRLYGSRYGGEVRGGSRAGINSGSTLGRSSSRSTSARNRTVAGHGSYSSADRSYSNPTSSFGSSNRSSSSVSSGGGGGFSGGGGGMSRGGGGSRGGGISAGGRR